jgi:hypothetical protein
VVDDVPHHQSANSNIVPLPSNLASRNLVPQVVLCVMRSQGEGKAVPALSPARELASSSVRLRVLNCQDLCFGLECIFAQTWIWPAVAGGALLSWRTAASWVPHWAARRGVILDRNTAAASLEATSPLNTVRRICCAGRKGGSCAQQQQSRTMANQTPAVVMDKYVQHRNSPYAPLFKRRGDLAGFDPSSLTTPT